MRTDLSSEYYCIRGYQASLRCSLAGLTLNIDMSVSAFLKGGKLIDLMWQVMGYRSADEMVKDASSPRGLDPHKLQKFEKVYKNAKCRTTHLKHAKRFK